MSKSRSNEDKEKDKERDSAEKEKEKENANDDTEGEDNAEGNSVHQLPMDQLQLTSDSNPDLKSPTSDSNSLMMRNEAAIPNSPPPSYEHVIEQIRGLKSRLENVVQQQEITEMEKHQEMSWTEKNTGGTTPMAEHKTVAKGPEILHKSSKEFYRAVAKQWGITCKMSDHCRCLDCQSHYFDCEYEKNEHQKTDGGLGAGTPMFISEVMQGSACVLL